MTYEEKLKQNAEYRRRNHAKILKMQADYRARHREELNRVSHEYYQRTKDSERERRNARTKELYYANAEKKREQCKAWRKKISRAQKDAINATARRRYAETLEESRRKNREHYYATHEARLADARRYRVRHKEEVLKKGRLRNKQDVQNLADWYVAMCLNLKDCPKELIEAKRELMKLRRLLKNDNNSDSKKTD